MPEGQVRVERLTVPNTNGHLNLKSILRILAARGINTLLVEGGAELHTSFLKAGLADELRLFIAPKLIGGKEAKGFFGGKGIRHMTDALSLDGMTVKKIGPDLLVSGRIRNGAKPS
jgi:diaminohydroxyphosphoribosylaminopyrimidine deaminase/5-amino-6-(5-phosphoribosylamino)uracil reductase